MPEAITLTDADFQSTLNDDMPVLVLISNGEGLRGEFSTAFKKAQGETQNIVFATINPDKNPNAKVFFSIASKPVLVGWYNGEEVVRRSRPWGTDVPLAIEMLTNAYDALQIPATGDAVVTVADEKKDEQKTEETTQQGETTMAVANDKPVNVSDATFQEDVIDYDLPVVVDFWAEWCGPCRAVAPTFDKLAKEFAGKVRVAKVNVDENPALSQTFRIQSIPTIMMLKDRNIVFSQPGALQEPALRDLFQQLVDLEIPEEAEAEADTEAEPTE